MMAQATFDFNWFHPKLLKIQASKVSNGRLISKVYVEVRQQASARPYFEKSYFQA